MAPEIAESLAFKPWYIADPIPPWLLNVLNENQRVRLAQVAVEFARTVLEAQLKANAQVGEILKGGGTR
jgi:hypothetical protein